jgi:hypothetical protein
MSLWPEGLAALAGRRVRSLGVLPPRWSIGRNGAFDPLQTQSAGRAVRVQGYFPVGSGTTNADAAPLIYKAFSDRLG